jgi:hypothetical protein
VIAGPDDGEIMAHVNRQHRDGAGLAVDRLIFQPIARGVLHMLRDDVIVGHEEATRSDGEAGAVEGLGGVGAEKTFDLDDRRAGALQRIAGSLGGGGRHRDSGCRYR